MSTRITILTCLCLLGASALTAQPEEQGLPEAVAVLQRHFEQVIDGATRSVVKVIATGPRARVERDKSDRSGEAGTTGKKARPPAVPRSISVSGLIIDREGHIVVPADPFEDGVAVFVTLQSAPGSYRQFRARLIGCDRARNVAVIRLLFPTPDLRPIRVGDPSRLKPGSLILGLGWPFRFPVSCSSGIVAGVNREIWMGKRRFAGLLMTTAAVHPGDSGGALLDVRGQVVGMLMSAFDPSGSWPGGRDERRATGRTVVEQVSPAISFAAPIDTVLVAAKAILARHPAEDVPAREATRFLGVYGSYLLEPNPLSTQLGLPARTGFVVSQVFEGEAAQRGGIRAHDVILQIGAVAIAGTGYSILTALQQAPLEGDLAVVVMRRGRKLNLTVRFEPGAGPSSKPAATEGNAEKSLPPKEDEKK